MKNRINILDLRPTQFAVGMLEVDEKISALKKLGKKNLKKHVQDMPVPVVRAPNSQLYVVDHHHFLVVCYHLGVKKVRFEIVKDFKGRKISYRKFWDMMDRGQRTYLYCQFGNGPHREFYLPRDVRGLADDPYRSLAWFVRKSGGFQNSEKNFAEFKWANFFREKKLLNRRGMAGFASALRKAVELAQSSEAEDLPGFGRLNLEKQKKVSKKAAKKVEKYRDRFKEREIVPQDKKASKI